MSHLLKPKRKKSALFPQPMLKLPSKRRETTANAAIAEGDNSIRMTCREGRLTEALRILNAMNESVAYSDYGHLLRGCINNKALSEGKLVHAHITQRGFEIDTFFGTELVTMYIKCGNLVDARRIFDQMPERNVVSWTAMIAGYARHGFGREALALFYQMQQMGFQPNQFTFAGVLPACGTLGSLEEGKEIHQEIIRNGFESHLFVGTALVDMYAKCGSLENARHVFDKTCQRDVFLWNVMIKEYARKWLGEEILGLCSQMLESNIQPDNFTFPTVLKACASLLSLQEAKGIHYHIVKNGLQSDLFVGASLIDMYVKLGTVEDARQVFDKMYVRDVVSWTAMIAGYVQNGHANEALLLFHEMQWTDVQPNSVTVGNVVIACAQLLDLQEGKRIHDFIIKSGYELDVPVGNSLVAMYTKCSNIDDARQVFDKISTRDVVSWTAMITAYVQNGHPREALNLYDQMQLAGVNPDEVTIVRVLSACADLGALQEGQWIHDYIVGTGLESDDSVGNSLISMYAKCGNMEVARQVFEKMSKRDVVSWNAMIAGYVENGRASDALMLVNQMQLSDVKPSLPTLLSMLSACSDLSDLHQGKWIHVYAIRGGFERHVSVANSLIVMYAKCGSAESARHLFDMMPERDVISWNSMIAVYVQNGQANEALTHFHQMQVTDVKPNLVTMVSVLPACAAIAALEQGKWIHDYIVRSGFKLDVSIGTALIDMYAKCGNIRIARQLFDKMSERDVVSWNAMIAAYGMHGHGEDALELFKQMQQTGTQPNEITFVCVLSACSHAGLVNEGWKYFDCMIQYYGILPMMKHYTCMVDLLGRAGCLDEAKDFIEKMPLEPDAGVWGALLGACRIHCNIELAERVAERLFYLDPKNDGYYVLLSNMYATAGRWTDVVKVRTLMNERGLKKMPGYSLIEVNKSVHTFLVGDRSHPQSREIYATLDILAGKMKEAGYVPSNSFVLQGKEEVKEHMLRSHS